MSSKLITAVKQAADQANQLMDSISNVHEIEYLKLRTAIRNANGNIYEAFTGKTHDPK